MILYALHRGGGKRSSKKNYNSLVQALYTLNEQGDLMRKYSYRQYFMTILQLAYSAIRVNERVLWAVKRYTDKLLVAMAYIPAYIIHLIK